MRLPSFLIPKTVVSAHCDLPCGVYDPAQARIEAQSVKAMQEKYLANEDPVFRGRAIGIIGERATTTSPVRTLRGRPTSRQSPGRRAGSMDGPSTSTARTRSPPSAGHGRQGYGRCTRRQAPTAPGGHACACPAS